MVDWRQALSFTAVAEARHRRDQQELAVPQETVAMASKARSMGRLLTTQAEAVAHLAHLVAQVALAVAELAQGRASKQRQGPPIRAVARVVRTTQAAQA